MTQSHSAQRTVANFTNTNTQLPTHTHICIHLYINTLLGITLGSTTKLGNNDANKMKWNYSKLLERLQSHTPTHTCTHSAAALRILMYMCICETTYARKAAAASLRSVKVGKTLNVNSKHNYERIEHNSGSGQQCVHCILLYKHLNTYLYTHVCSHACICIHIVSIYYAD